VNISDEAVEAAAKALKSRCGAWDSWTVLALTALEAAAPYMLEEAFNYGWREGKGIPTPCNIETGELQPV
jgi:hypothetical protein